MTPIHRRVPLLILGAGMAGLGAGVQAQRLDIESLLLEAEPEIGGLCRSLTSITGCCFDFGPKILILDDSDNSKDILRFFEWKLQQIPPPRECLPEGVRARRIPYSAQSH